MIPYTKPDLDGSEIAYITEALRSGHLHGGGEFTKRSERWLESRLGTHRAILTPSCTAALEMAAILCDVGPGDEVIMPSFTFVSTANAVVLRGGVPVFVDVRPDTMNMDEDLAAAAVTDRTKAIFAVHYAGTMCDMERLVAVARPRGAMVVEDAAQALLSTRDHRHAGTIGDLGCLSFHSTKNVTCGEGGALLVNDPALAARAEVIHEKGTDRSRFLRGEVDKYSWRDVGSSFVPSEVTAAFLLAQLERADAIGEERRRIWDAYHRALEPLETAGIIRRQAVPAACEGNAHIYFVITRTAEERSALIAHLRARGISATFHYVPLHSAPAGLRYARSAGPLPVTESLSDRLVRLPIWSGLDPEPVIEAVLSWSRSPLG